MSEINKPKGGGAPIPFSSPKSGDAQHYTPKHNVHVQFPDKGMGRAYQKPATIPNVLELLLAYDIKTGFNVITKELVIDIPGVAASKRNHVETGMTIIESLAATHGLATTGIRAVVSVIANQMPINPVHDWIVSKPWDGTSRFDAFSDAVITVEEFPPTLKTVLLKKWLRSAVAAATMPDGFHGRGVLTFQGPQGIGKSSLLRSLVPDPVLCEKVVNVGYSWNGGAKDARVAAIGHWIVELGELESSFKRELGALKAFITQKEDKIRPVYARADVYYPRQTVFAATVNERNFLKDPTGNSRFWTIPVTALNYEHGIDMQQLYAELLVELQQGEIWWLTPNEEAELALSNLEYRDHGPTGEQVLALLDLSRKDDPTLDRMTANMVLSKLGYERPSNSQSKECNAVLREYLGQETRSKGQNWWRVPLVKQPNNCRY